MARYKLPAFHFLLIVILCYLFYGTGFYSDDFIEFTSLYNLKIDNVYDFFHIDTTTHQVAIFSIFSSYFHRAWLLLFGDNYILYFIPKVIISYLSIYLVYKFFSQFLSVHNAFLIAIFFVLYPLHDATNYWFSALKYTMVPAIILYGNYLVNQARYKSGFLTLIIGSFYGFSSPAYTIGVSFYFFLKKEYKKFIIAFLPGFLYILFYFTVTVILSESKGRIESGLNILKLIKQYLLQVGTFLDTAVGPSLWLKLYYSFTQLTYFSIFIALIFIYFFHKVYIPTKETINGKLLLSFLIVLLLGLGIFALTGLYPQMAFNLGNRVTIYGSLFMSFIIVFFLLKNKIIATLIFSIFIFTTIGISDHWKAWTNKQISIMQNIKNNKKLKDFDINKPLFVTYNQYSNFGKISHIEFFTEGIAQTVFKLSTGKTYNVSTLNKRFYYNQNKIIDKKYGISILVEDEIYIYDSNLDIVLEVKKEDIQKYIDSLPKDTRHWLQLVDRNNFFLQIVIKLMPRLNYAL